MPDTTLTPREAFAAIQDFTLHGRDITDLYASDAVHEWPFRIPGGPQRLVGHDQLAPFFENFRADNTPIHFDAFTNVTYHETTDPEVLVVEYGLRGTLAPNRKPFDFNYILVLHVHDNKIVEVRDYLNPLAMTDALSLPPFRAAARVLLLAGIVIRTIGARLRHRPSQR